MEDNETKKSEVEVDGLGLIDVAAEDDSLLFSSFVDPTSYSFSDTDKDETENCFKNDKDLNLLSETQNCDEDILASSIEEKKEVLQPHDEYLNLLSDTGNCDEDILVSSIEEKKEVLQPHDKYLSLLSDTGNCDEDILVSSIEEKKEVLQPHESPEPEKVVKKGKYNLRKSLAWDNAFFTSAGVLEPEELSSMMESNHKSERKALPTIQEDVNRSTESISTFHSDCTVDNSQEFVLFEDVRASIQRSAKASDAATPGKNSQLAATDVAISPTSSTLDVLASQEKMKPKASPKKPSSRAQGLGKSTKQSVSIRGLGTSISKTPNGVSKVRPFSATSTNRSSLDISKTKQEKNSRLPAGKEPLGPRISISRSIRPTLSKPVVLKSTLRSSAASKNELTSSCSSLESCASASSSASHKSSLDSIKKKNDSSARLASQSLANRSTSRGIMGKPRIPPHPINKTSKSKLSSSVPTAGSISDSTSSESSRASATTKMAKSKQNGEKCPANDNTLQTVKPLKNSKEASVVHADGNEGTKRTNGGLVPPTSMIKPSGLRVPLPKIGFFDGARNGSSLSASKKSGKSQLAKSPIQELSNSKAKASSKHDAISASSPKVTNKVYSEINAED